MGLCWARNASIWSRERICGAGGADFEFAARTVSRVGGSRVSGKGRSGRLGIVRRDFLLSFIGI